MIEFSYVGLPWNIIFGTGALKRLPEELDKLGYHRALVLVTPHRVVQGQALLTQLGSRAAGLFDRATMHVPADTVNAAIAAVERLNVDCSVSLGGGSTTGLGKALALKLGLPNIAIPTTYAGSELTNIWGITEGNCKITGRDNIVLPRLTIYDPELTLGLPAHIAGSSGMNALAQAAVNVTARDVNPMVSLMALEAVRMLAQSLPRVVEQPDNIDARGEALYGACLAGSALGTGITSLQHRLCHTLGGTFNMPHAETHSVLLAHCIAYNAEAVPNETARLAQALGVDNAAMGIFALAQRLGAPTALRAIGFKENDLLRAAALATETTLNNPEPVCAIRVKKLLENAFHGRPPTAID